MIIPTHGLRRLALHATYRFPFNLFRNFLQRPVLVLTYHRVANLKYDPVISSVSVENFKKHIRFYKKNFQILRLGDSWENLDRPTIVLTFDDGYADNFLNALSVLEEEGVPATFFIATGKIGTHEEYWWDALERCIFESGRSRGIFHSLGQRWVIPEGCRKRMTLYHDIHSRLYDLKVDRKMEIIQDIQMQLGIPHEGRESHRVMSLEELRKMAASPYATIGAHTVDHNRIALLNRDEQVAEIVGSKRQLEEWMGKSVDTFAYPYGRKRDISKESEDICREAGFKKVVTTNIDQARVGENFLNIPRFPIRDWDMGMLRMALAFYPYI